ncbi:zinc-ribbon domain-containing protein [Natronolimnohabitans innermongolicus]|uniref:Uncharacterized protein n=1 Tax=Natronolimnohabitans innermongolicus JCM 12255 TaxID=1227499 RepID=L9X726_9EURY|nr:zinc ribbon domain-containing protein [Natronolimnohabitans innermongolicus]ELY57495.1 hypothetical protein C493_08416 [Natronolimnohabitans innermongolicus JCM 12255]
MDEDPRSSRAGESPRYCSQCGSALESAMNYCPNCGTPVGADEGTGVSKTHSSDGERSADETTDRDRDVLEYRIAEAMRDGWELEHDFGDHAVMIRRTVGDLDEHVAVAILTIWFTMGMGNVAWGAYRYFGSPERIVLRADGIEGKIDDDDDASRSVLLGRITAVFCWLVAAAVAAVAVQFGVAGIGYLFLALALAFAIMGTVSLPSVNRRLEGRRSITANGRVRSVDERTVVDYDRPCSACGAAVGRGLERTYRKEFCLLGVPLSRSEGRNYYCRECATGADASVRSRTAEGKSAADFESSRSLETDANRNRETEAETERESS